MQHLVHLRDKSREHNRINLKIVKYVLINIICIILTRETLCHIN